MWLLIREASMARNLQALLPLVLEYGPGRIAFCTDDRDPEDIADNGHINGMVRDAVAAGVTPGGCARDGLAPSGPVARARPARGDRARLPGRPPRPARPRALRARRRPQARPPDRGGAVRRRFPTGCARRVRVAPVRPRGPRDSVDRRPDPRDRAGRRSGRDRVARPRSRRRGRARRRRRDAPTSPRSPSSSGTSQPVASASASSRARACSAARSRRPSHTTPTTSSSSG